MLATSQSVEANALDQDLLVLGGVILWQILAGQTLKNVLVR